MSIGITNIYDIIFYALDFYFVVREIWAIKNPPERVILMVN